MLLATGGASAANAADFWVDCSAWSPAAARTVCSETSASAAFGFLGWLARAYPPSISIRECVELTVRCCAVVWAYTGTLLVMLIIQAQRGNYVWQQSVKEANFQGGNKIQAVATSEVKPYDTGAPGQVPYAYPPSNPVPTQQTGAVMV